MRDRKRDRVAHGPAPSLKLAAAAGVNESANLLLRAPLRFALFLLCAPASTPRVRHRHRDPRPSPWTSPRSSRVLLPRDSPSPRSGLKSSFSSDFVIIGGHEIALQYVNKVAGLIVPLARKEETFALTIVILLPAALMLRYPQ